MTDKLSNIKSPAAYKEDAFKILLRDYKVFKDMAENWDNPEAGWYSASDKRIVFMIRSIMEYLEVAEKLK